MAYDKSIPRLLQPPATPPPGTIQRAQPWHEPQHPAGADPLARAEGAWVDGQWHPATPHEGGAGSDHSGIGKGDKGDHRTLVEAPKPNEERETGDLERGERETHGRATCA